MRLFTARSSARRLLLAVLFVLAGHSSLWAQTLTGSCPASTNTGTVRSGAPFRIYWCQPQGDTLVGAKISGLPAGTFQLDNVKIERGPFAADNLTQWSAAVPAQPRGSYTIVVIAQNYGLPGDPKTLQESQPSPPFALGVVDSVPVPAAPKNLRESAGNPAP